MAGSPPPALGVRRGWPAWTLATGPAITPETTAAAPGRWRASRTGAQ
ncbi:hypothetical protein ACIBQX_37400 [Nonomuraea sp. NPDC049714]